MEFLAPDRRLQDAVAAGLITFSEPRMAPGGLYAVDITDTDSFEVVTKTFPSKARAAEWVATQLVGDTSRSVANRVGRTGSTKVGGVQEPDADDGTSIAAGMAAAGGYATTARPEVRNGGQTRTATKDRFRLRPVRDVLEAYELDPTAEIAKAMQATKPVFKDGVPVLGEDGKPLQVPVLDERTRAMVATELMQYVTPKLKAIEVIPKDDTPRTPEEIDAKLNQLIASREALIKGAVR